MSGVQHAKPVRTIGVPCVHLTIFNDKPSRNAARIFAVNKDIGGNLTEDGIPKASAFNAFKIKRVWQVLLNKGQNAVVAFDEIGAYQIAVVVAVNIDLAQDQIGSMYRTNFQDKQVRCKQHNSSQSDSVFPCYWILLIELSTLEQLQIIHIRPRVIIPVYTNISTALFNQFRAKIFDLNPRVYLVFAERRLFTLVEMSYQCGVICNIQITIFITVINAANTPMHLRAFRHIDTQQGFPVKLDNIYREIRWRSKLQRVVDGSDKVFFDLCYKILLNPLNGSIILNTE